MPKSALPKPTPDMFIHNNPYGYKLAIRHPEIHPLYQRYKKSKGLARVHPVSDHERLDFEDNIISRMDKYLVKAIFAEIERRTEKST